MSAKQVVSIESPPIHVSARDLERLRGLVDQYGGGRDASSADRLANELERAVVLPEDRTPPDLVTMNARVVFEDETGKRRDVTLVYPWEADLGRGRLSVLAPVGAALLGLSSGQSIAWPLPSGRTAKLTVLEVVQAPAAADGGGATSRSDPSPAGE